MIKAYLLENLLIAFILASIGFGINKAISLLLSYLPKNTRKLQIKEKFNEDPNYLCWQEAIAAIVGFSIAPNDSLLGIAFALYGVFFLILIKKVLATIRKKLTEEKRSGEILFMYEIISIYTNAGYSLYEALCACQQYVKYNKDALNKCIMLWSQGPEKALKLFTQEVNNPEAEILSGILQRAVTIGPAKMTNVLHSESTTMEKLRLMRVEQGLGVRSIIQTIYLVFPGLALLGVTLLPIGFYITQQIRSLHF